MLPDHSPIILRHCDYLAVCELVHRLAGIRLQEGKESLVAARVGKRMRELGLRVVGDYLRQVADDASGDELVRLLDALATNTTSFLREPAAFTMTAERFRQGLLQGRRRFRWWSAACSSGEEPVTLAIVLLETLQQLGRPSEGLDLAILATDLSTRILARARAGTYPAQAIAIFPPEWQRRHFQAADDLVRTSDQVRRLITWSRLNLIEPPWPMRGPFDAVFCRNVMIYFDPPTRERLVQAICPLLAPGGLLLIGAAESLTGLTHPLRHLRPSVYQKG